MAYEVKTLGGGRVQLTYVEVVASLALAGWREDEWAKAAAVIAAESDRVINIYNTYKKGHYGLMQISASAHPGFFKSLPNPNGWVDPVANIKYGYKLRKQSGFQPWEAYTNGRWTGYLIQAKSAVAAVKSKRVRTRQNSGDFYRSLFRPKITAAIEAIQLGQAVKNVADLIGAAGEATGQAVATAGEITAKAAMQQAGGITGALQLAIGAGRWLSDPHNWIRVAQVGVGSALVLGGITALAKPAVGQQLRTAVKTAGKATAAGKAAGKATGTAAKKTAATAKKTAAKAKKAAKKTAAKKTAPPPAKKTAAKKTAPPKPKAPEGKGSSDGAAGRSSSGGAARTGGGQGAPAR